MKLSYEQRRYFRERLKEWEHSERVKEMRDYIQHGHTSTYKHCISVAYYSYLLSLKLPIKMNQESLIKGALLHDFYLYDWHEKGHQKLHGFFHPKKALENAKLYYELTPIEEDIIAKHMWPLTITKMPRCREAILICLVDKYCSFGETIYLERFWKKKKYIVMKKDTKES